MKSRIFSLFLLEKMILHAKSKNLQCFRTFCHRYNSLFKLREQLQKNKYLQLQYKVKSVLSQWINWIHNERDDDVNAV